MMRRRIFKTALLVVLAAGFLAGIIVLAQWARDDLQEHERFSIAFAEIDCAPPPGMTRAEFLDEVRYEASPAAARLPLLDRTLPDRLRDIFARHPWVERVAEVVVTPPRHVHVKLIYRMPVLCIRVAGGLKAVDANGILLPKQAPTAGLPEFRGEASPPQGPAGTRWGDPRVEAAAAALRRS